MTSIPNSTFPQQGVRDNGETNDAVPERIDVGGRRLALWRSGEGTPTVVLETGIGAPSAEWWPIHHAVAQFTRVCHYDRAGREESDPAPVPRTADDMTADLRVLLTNAGERPPYVLVGHSLGGLIVRHYMQQHPEEVAGMVLVDALHGEEFARIAPLIPPPFPAEPLALTNLRQFWSGGYRDPAATPEQINFPASIAQVRDITSFGDLPLVVLVAGSREMDIPAESQNDPNAKRFSAAMAVQMEEMQRELASLSTNSTLTVVPGTGHFIQRYQPDAIVAAIAQVVDAIRRH